MRLKKVALYEKQLKTTAGRKKIKTKKTGYITPTTSHYPMDGQMGDIDPPSDM